VIIYHVRPSMSLRVRLRKCPHALVILLKENWSSKEPYNGKINPRLVL